MAFVLAGTSNTANMAGSGYAVVVGNSGAPDPFRLAKYNVGFAGIVINIITANTTGYTANNDNYYSVKVVYTPTTNTWELFLRDDGATSFADPSTEY